jgi:serine/threonine protein phosphatase 1
MSPFSLGLAAWVLRPENCLYLLWDYVDRGPDSKGVLDIILQLHVSGYEIRPVRGNHNHMLLNSATGNHDQFSPFWFECWGQEALKSFCVINPADIGYHRD